MSHNQNDLEASQIESAIDSPFSFILFTRDSMGQNLSSREEILNFMPQLHSQIPTFLS